MFTPTVISFCSKFEINGPKNKWLEWDSNPRLRRDQCLKLAPWTARPSNLAPLAAGFEPTRAEPIRFRVWPLNHSGMLTCQLCKPAIPDHCFYFLGCWPGLLGDNSKKKPFPIRDSNPGRQGENLVSWPTRLMGTNRLSRRPPLTIAGIFLAIFFTAWKSYSHRELNSGPLAC